MEERAYDTVILSDLHLGSETSRAAEALDLLERLSFRRLILLGDIFSDLNFRRLKKEHWRFLSYIRKLSNPKRGVEVVWVEGNHDSGLIDVMSHLVGMHAYREYVWEQGGRRHLAIHGHQFDSFVVNNRLSLISLGSSIYLLIQKLGGRGRRLAQLLDQWNTRWLRLSEKVAAGAMAAAKARGAVRVFCGHTHHPTSLERNGIEYFNSGAWTNGCPTYITIADEEVRIHEYTERTDDHYSRQERGETLTPAPGLAGSTGLSPDGGYEPAYC
jgi:UDP-2,3-diacylglucosamine pyrophosphatase LpxH